MEKRKITDAIVIHCSATPEGREHNVADLRAWHLARGFSDVGYHYVVRLDGTVEAGRGEEYVGAHCVESGMNRRSIGVCYVGGMDRGMKSPKDTRTEAQRRSLLELVRQLQKKYGIPDGRVFGHRDFAKKACPSFDVRTMFSVVLAALMIMSVACTRKIYIPVENVAVRSDTVYVSKNAVAREVDRDTVIVRERGDTVTAEVVRWRWRERVVSDTVAKVVRDSVFVRETVPAPDGSRSRDFWSLAGRVLVACGVVAIAVAAAGVWIKRKVGR